MALRLLEMNVPEEHVSEALKILEENNIGDYWQTCGCDSSTVFKIIMPYEATENLLTIIETRYGSLPEFHAVLTSLDAAIPSVKEMEEET